MSCFKFFPFSRHVPLTIYQHNMNNILQAENEKKYKDEIVKKYEDFFVKIIQLYYDDDYEIYKE